MRVMSLSARETAVTRTGKKTAAESVFCINGAKNTHTKKNHCFAIDCTTRFDKKSEV